MAECLLLKGGGADLDVITATAPDILAGKVIVGPDGEPLTGTLALDGNAADNQVLAGRTYYNTDPKLKRSGTIASMAGQTINPTASQQTVASSGKYLTGNVVVNAVAGLSAGNIKKNAVVGGVTGTFEGYVPTATDLYLRGNNIAGLTIVNSDYCKLDAGQITMYSNNPAQTVGIVTSSQWVNFVGKNYLHIEMLNERSFISTSRLILFPNRDISTQSIEVSGIPYGNTTVTFNISGYQTNAFIQINKQYIYGAIFRIWLT